MADFDTLLFDDLWHPGILFQHPACGNSSELAMLQAGHSEIVLAAKRLQKIQIHECGLHL